MHGWMEDQVCLLTDGVTPVGKELAVSLAKMDARVVLVSPDARRGAVARDEVAQRSGGKVSVLIADLASRDDVTELAANFLCDHDRLDVLVNNAERVPTQRTLTVDGWESTFAVNHLAPFLLTRLLMQQLKTTEPMRIINVVSGAHAESLSLEDLNGNRSFDPAKAYAATKLMNLLFTYELARRTEGTRVTVNAVHPGVSLPMFALPKARAVGPLFLATSALLEDVSGQYFVKMKQARSALASYDPALAVRLWNLSAQFVELNSAPMPNPVRSLFVARSPAYS